MPTKVPVELGPQKYNYSVIKCPPDETGFECGVLEVPVDWHDPNLGSTGLNIYRRISQNASERRGTIFMHGGTLCTCALRAIDGDSLLTRSGRDVILG